MAKDLRVIKTQENIRSHFISLLKDYTFQEISIKRLINECKINRSTFYRNYTDKYDLLNQIIEDLLKKYKKAVCKEIVTLPPDRLQNLSQYLYPLVSFFDDYKDLLLTLDKNYIPVHLFDNMDVIMNTCFLEGFQSSYAIKDMKKATYYLNLITGNILTTMKWWHYSYPELSRQEIIDILITCSTKGIFLSMKELT